MRHAIRIFLFVTFFCVLIGSRAGAQQASATTPKPSPTNPVPTPIPLSEIAGQAQSASESLRGIETSLIFPVALLANVFGYVNFANFLGSGVLRSAYVAAALYAALRIVEGLIIISLEARPLGLMRVVRLNRPMLQRRICGVVEFLVFLYWLTLTLNFFGLRTPLITSTEAALQANLTIGALSISLGQYWCSYSRFGVLSWSRGSCVFFSKETSVAVDEALTRENIAIA